MFGLFESDKKKANRLYEEFQAHMAKIDSMSGDEQVKMHLAIGSAVYELELSGMGNPATAHGAHAKKLASHLRRSAETHPPKAALIFNLLATTAEVADIDDAVAHYFRNGAEQMFLMDKLKFAAMK